MPKVLDFPDGVTRCCRCGKPLDIEKDFYKSNSDLHFATGRFPMCKDCMGEVYDDYSSRYSSQRVGLQRFCMAFDIYYSDSLYETCTSDASNVLGNYLKKLNLANYRNKTFDDSLREGFAFEIETKNGKKKKHSFKDEPAIGDLPDEDDVERWGEGLSLADYKILNSHYKELKKYNPNCDSNQEIFIIELCYSKMLQMRATREGKTDDFARMSEQYRKTFEKAGLKTVRDVSEVENFTIGVSIETIERFTPAEYYKNKGKYADFDSLGEYIMRHMTRPLRNLQHGSVDRDHEFYISDADDEDGDL